MTTEKFMDQLRVVASCALIGVLVLAVMWWVQVEQSVQQALVLQVATAAVAWIIGTVRNPRESNLEKDNETDDSQEFH